MTRYLLLLLLGIGLLQAPSLLPSSLAQDEDDDDEESSIEVEDEPGDDGYDEEETRKKNAGLAGGGKRDDGDANAPKVKLSLQQQINKAIKDGVAWLKKSQRKDGSWGPVVANRTYGSKTAGADRNRDETGPTAFALYTLAKCGVKKSDKSFKKGLKWLKDQTMVTFDMTGNKNKDNLGRPTKTPLRNLTTYEHAAIIMLIEAMNEKSAKLTGKHKKRRLYTDNPLKRPRGSKIPKDEWQWMHNRVLALTTGRRISSGKGSSTILGHQHKTGGWRYGAVNNPGEDLSATQFALLGLRAASQAGYPVSKVSPKSWSAAAEYVRKMQVASGGFRYGHQGPTDATGSMTACGIVSLVICREQIEIDGKTAPSWINPSVKRGLDALDKMYLPAQNTREGAGHMGHNYYYMYGVERAGDIVGRKEFGGKDWYVRGALYLVGAQQGGKWVDATAFRPHDVLGTCFALLFLKRATPPTVTFTDR